MSARDYNHQEIEAKWQKQWEKDQIYKTENQVNGRDNFYTLFEFPYPSGNLHVGHWYAFGPTDVLARYQRMNGKNVLFPVGFDSFGLPAENAAIKRGLDPRAWTYDNIAVMTNQIKSMGTSVDWSREVKTSDPEYFKWSQYIFTQFMEKGLAYESEQEVNYCPSCKTVVANEQVVNGECERCGSVIEKRTQKQWTLRITDYAEQLLDDLDQLDWPEEIKAAQRAWIGKSQGAKFTFNIKDTNDSIEVFTTRPDTLYGVTYCVLAPEHKLVQQLKSKITNYQEVSDYVEATRAKSELDRQKNDKDKTGVILEGVFAIHPATGEELPIFIADYVLGSYGTGAIMAVPAHDERDFTFAKEVAEPAINNQPKYFIFDFDGVLGDTFEDLSKAMVEAGFKDTVQEAKDHSINYSLNPHTHSRNHTKEDRFRADNWAEIMSKVVNNYDFKLFDEFVKSIKMLNLEKIAVVSSGLNSYITKALAGCGLEFTHILAYDDHHSKEEKVEQICKDWGVDINEVYYFTDTKADVYELENIMNRSKIIGCSWGYLDRETLLEVLPENQVLNKQADVIDMFSANLVKQVVAPYFGENFSEKDEFTLRPSAFGLLKDGNKVLLQKAPVVDYKTDKVSHLEYRLPGGGIDNDSFEAGLVREVEEETGFIVNNIPNNSISVYRGFVSVYGGSKGKKFLAHKKAYLIDFKDCSEGSASPEDYEAGFEYEWVSLDELEEKISINKFFTEETWLIRELLNPSPILEKGVVIRSGKYDGQTSEEAGIAIVEEFGESATTYRLRDWSIGRQRYWGCPIPVVYDPQGAPHAVAQEYLPWLLPNDVDHTPDGTAPLARSVELVERTEKIFGKGWTPATDTIDAFVDSSWYYVRYTDPRNTDELASISAQKAWLPVDFYSGGAEHTTMHLLYARFYYKAMRDCGLVAGDEPFKNRMNRSLILGPDGNKMSKSKGNVIDPDQQVVNVGADALRMYLCFMGPYNEVSHYPWDPNGLVGVRKFIERVNGLADYINEEKNKDIEIALHKSIKGVTDSIEQKKLNTGVSSLMIFSNLVEKVGQVTKDQLRRFTQLISVYTPHMAEVWWQLYDGEGSVHTSEWPKYDEKLMKTETVTIPVQVNGKRIGQITAPRDAAEDMVRKLATGDTKLKIKITGDLKKVIYVKNRILNLVIDKKE